MAATQRGTDSKWRKVYMLIRIIFLALLGLFFILTLDSYYEARNRQALETLANIKKIKAGIIDQAIKAVLDQTDGQLPARRQNSNVPGDGNAQRQNGAPQFQPQVAQAQPVRAASPSVQHHPPSGSERILGGTVQQRHPLYASCSEPVKPVIFVKTHKTGSSTFTNIIMRHADNYNLRTGLPPEGKWELGAYPAKLNKKFIEPYGLEEYDVMSHHFRLDPQKLKEMCPADTRVVTILRETVGNVESAFGFFRDQEPFDKWMEGEEMSQRLEKFYNNPSTYYRNSDDWYFRAKNMLFFDMGYDPDKDHDDAYLASAINELDQTLTLVLITDYFDESLVLLKHALCWDWQDILYVKFKMRTDDAKTVISPDLAERIKSWNRADLLMYQHYNATFWTRAREYGLERLQEDVAELQRRNKEAEKKCVLRYEPFKKKSWILHAVPRRPQSAFCTQLQASELVYSDILKSKMYYKMNLGLKKPTRDQTQKVLQEFDVVQKAALHV